MFKKQVGIAKSLHLHKDGDKAKDRYYRDDTQNNGKHPDISVPSEVFKQLLQNRSDYLLQCSYCCFELVTSVFVIFKQIEAGTCRRQQNS